MYLSRPFRTFFFNKMAKGITFCSHYEAFLTFS